MRSILGRLVIWVAEILDRNLLTVPEVDEYYPPTAGSTDPRHDREIERTRPILRDLIAARAGEPPGFVRG
jgi:hypothetical protein